MQKRYQVLQTIGVLLKIAGVAEFVFGVICLIFLPLTLSSSDTLLIQFGFNHITPNTGILAGIISGVLIFFIGVICGLLTFSLGELFGVVISIEENSRSIVTILQKDK